MKTFTATEARTRFGAFISDAQRGPVAVTRRGQRVGVMMSAADFELARVFYAERLRKTIDQAARRSGLTPKEAEDLLADES
jgi:prevent-host-death family protein